MAGAGTGWPLCEREEELGWPGAGSALTHTALHSNCTIAPLGRRHMSQPLVRTVLYSDKGRASIIYDL